MNIQDYLQNSHSCPAASDIEDFCLRNHKANSVQSLLFVVWVIEARQVWNCPYLKTSTHLAMDACTVSQSYCEPNSREKRGPQTSAGPTSAQGLAQVWLKGW